MNSNQPDVQVTDEMVVDALILGLYYSDPQVVRSCCLALCVLATIAVPRLTAAAQKDDVSSRNRRLLNLALQIIQEPLLEGDVNKVVAVALVKAFCIRNQPLNRLAKRAMPWCGPAVVDELVCVALDNIRKPTVCTRLLRAAFECSIRPTGITCTNLLTGLSMTKNAAIQRELLQLFTGFGPFAATLADAALWSDPDAY